MDGVREQIILRNPPVCADVRIAVIDSGVDTGHPDLRGVVDDETSRSFTALSDDITDRWYHGTHIAGIIAGTGDASNGRYSGLAVGARLSCFKVATGGAGNESDVARAIETAIELDADIINYSASYSPQEAGGPAPWVWPARMSLLEEYFRIAARHGVLCVVAAGNDGPQAGSINRPGGLLEVLTIGAISRNGLVLDVSSRGPYRVLQSLPRNGQRRFDEILDTPSEERVKPDIVMPGEAVAAPRSSRAVGITEQALTDPSDPECAYLRVSGTSQATAVATGVAACLLQTARDAQIDLGPDRGLALRELMKRGARRLAVGDRNDYGFGLVTWPILLQELRDFAADPAHRALVLNGPQLKLLE